jgi:hypothetical protein
MTVHIISVGLSMLCRLTDPARLEQAGLTQDQVKTIGRARPQDVISQFSSDARGDRASAWLVSAFCDLTDARHDEQAAARLATVADAVKPKHWTARMSAELQTFGRVQGATIPVRPADTVVLVCSDTVDGLVAGLWNAAGLSGGDLTRVSYLPDPADEPGQVRGRVLLVRVKHLDASSERGFSQAMKGLGTLGRALLDSPEVGKSDAFRFYLSGGFKAAIPYLIGLAEGVRSAGGDREVNAYVLHETGRSDAIRLPLRRMTRESVASELDHFDEDTGTSPPFRGARLLYGYAYEDDGEGYKLTPFGEGLRALFPDAYEKINPSR